MNSVRVGAELASALIGCMSKGAGKLPPYALPFALFLCLLITPALAGTPRGTQAPKGVRVPSRIGEKYLEVRQRDGSYAPVFIKGMNLSVALPGRFPSEIPYDEMLYRRWLKQIADMNCNTIRLYTILTPEFYKAFRWHNLNHPDQQLWLIHGIWAEAPPGHNYLNTGYMQELEMEMRNAVDAVHGTAIIFPRPGHAEGKYEADCSPWLLAWVIGREWEPDDILAFQQLHPEFTTYRGGLISAYDVQPIEAWLARICDYAVSYQQQKYRVQLPATFSNWPPTDPMSHISESNIEDEADLIRRDTDSKVDEFSNDAVNLSAKHFTAEAAYSAGIFASYHVYPYYPDFIDNDPEYQDDADRFGPSTYAGYLKDLKAYYDDRPLLIAEYGLPNGPLSAHLQQQGWSHAGLSEAEVAEAMPRLTLALLDTGTAGGCVFAWIDEWFKKVWLWTDLYDPFDEIRLWFNALDAEQNYGMQTLRPALPGSDPPRAACTLSGKLYEWESADAMLGESVTLGGARTSGPHGEDEGTEVRAPKIDSVRVMHDQGYFYVGIVLDNFEDLDFSEHRLSLGLDVLDPDRGNFSFPGPLELKSNLGLECALVISGGAARFYQTDSFRFWTPYKVPYSLQPRIAEAKPWVLKAEDNPYAWAQPIAETNRRRVGRDGTVYPPQNAGINPLPGGSLIPDPEHNDLALWNVSATSLGSGYPAALVELRIPWILMGFVGPHQRRVLQSAADGSNSSVVSDGIHMALAVGDRRGNALAAWPAVQPGEPTWVVASAGGRYTWDEWGVEDMAWYSELKPVYFSLQELFGSLSISDARPLASENSPQAGTISQPAVLVSGQ